MISEMLNLVALEKRVAQAIGEHKTRETVVALLTPPVSRDENPVTINLIGWNGSEIILTDLTPRELEGVREAFAALYTARLAATELEIEKEVNSNEQ